MNANSTEQSVHNQARDAAGNMSKDIGNTSGELHKDIDKAAAAAQPVVDKLASSAHAGVDKVSTALTGASQQIDDKSRQLSEAYSRFAETGRGYVRNSPATSVLVALAAGYGLSKLLNLRK